ncbi:glycosyltransferase family 25 protein [Acetobacter sp. LMG 32666]|uniref:glycosyltransferase family 25 protein n=1 Tax=Acetobacter sp. LMG 32666 TaxID=2959295 RepID=UPI0030C80DB6
MHKYFISLERTPERTERFLKSNAHIKDFEWMPGLDGKTLDRNTIVSKGLLAPDCGFTAGAIGSGLTHIKLWAKIAQSGQPAHIFEDDAFLCRNFEHESNRIIATLPHDWDIILWGNNYDSILEFELLPGITQCVAMFNQDTVRQGIPAFLNMNVASTAFRLTQTFGICGYALSPLGANRLLKLCLPFKTEEVFYPGLGRSLATSSVDHLMNIHYRNIHAYTALPPLCLTDNNTARSLNT